MEKCCGESRDTPFCPICGQRLSKDINPLRMLVVHCRRTAASHQTQSENWRKAIDGAENETIRSRLQKRIASEDGLAAKWNQWADELEKLLNQESEPKK